MSALAMLLLSPGPVLAADGATCGNFQHQEEAQAALGDDASAAAALDGDGNGRACDFLPGRFATSSPAPPTPPCRVSSLVVGAIRDRYAVLGGECSGLGLPVAGEMSTPGHSGRYNDFQRGSIYWSPSTGAWEVQGAIEDAWARLGRERSPVGFPIAGERRTPTKAGAFSTFANGSIYWSPSTGPHEVYGAIGVRWAGLGWEDSALGFPVTGEFPVPGGRAQDFQYGSIGWTPSGGTTAFLYPLTSADVPRVLP